MPDGDERLTFKLLALVAAAVFGAAMLRAWLLSLWPFKDIEGPMTSNSTQGELGKFIDKEQAEVYLLMDHLSGRSSVRLRDEKISVPDLNATVVNGVSSLIERPLVDVVCEVRWPPKGGEQHSESYVAAVLLKARDRLSEIANPASGASVAFTTFVTNAMSNAVGGGDNPAGRVIVDTAKKAYPDYERLARSFNIRRSFIGWALPVWLLLTLLASFVLAYFSVCASPSMGGCPVGDHSRIVKILQEQGLPVCYGLVGALAGVLRTVQGKIRDALLMPRDRMYIIMQLWLGVVMGATVGLFNLDTSGGAAGLTAGRTIAPTALSFIAGLGVDSVFSWVEGLVRALFGNRGGSGTGAEASR